MNNDELISTVRELGEVRRAIEAGKRSTPDGARRMNTMLHLTAATLAGALLMWELRSPLGPTAFLIQTHFIEQWRGLAIGLIGFALVLLVSLAYGALWCAAHLRGEYLEQYIARNFSYLHFLSFASDLFLKFCGVSLVILGGRPDWVAPLLLVYLGDYLIQGRLFLLPVRLALLAALCLILLGVLQCLLWYGSLILPLSACFTLSSLSLFFLAKQQFAVARAT